MHAVADASRHAEELVADGRLVEAIEVLTAANRERRDPEIEVRLAVLRHRAWSEVKGRETATPWPPFEATPLPGVAGLPDVSYADLTPELLARAVFAHGALIVRGLFTDEINERLNHDIDQTMATVRRFIDEGASASSAPEWFTPIDAPGYDLGGVGRFWVLNNGTVWTADSPRTLFDLVDSIEQVGLGSLLTEFFGVRPVLSIMKCAMRRIPADGSGQWHQDGYVAGAETRALNVWISTSRSGDVSPGLDILPTRLDHMVDTDQPPPFDFCVSDDLVADLARTHPVVTPTFAPGDAVFFDQYLLHQTGTGVGFDRERYGFECWFFSPSTFPERFAPLVF